MVVKAKIMKLLNYLFLIQVLLVLEIYSWRTFNRGRSVGGNLGVPEDDESAMFGLASVSKPKHIDDQWFTQTLDHFDPTDGRTWEQRYFVNTDYYNASSGAPVFLMVGGEGTASRKWMRHGSWINYARRFGALCFQLEHRYYGKSHPTKDLSTKNLQYLNSQQALADLATFIAAMNKQYGLTFSNKWIAFGGSYPGSLAAWLRLKYPHLVHGSMSASSPLLAQVDFSNYFKVVDESLSTYSEQCVEAVKEGTYQIDVLLRHMIGQRNINKKFRLCDPVEESVKNPNDIANLYETLSTNFAGVVQYNKDNRMGDNKNITIDTLCEIMMNQELGPPVDRLAAVNSLLLNSTKQKCLDYKYDKMIDSMRNNSWNSDVSEGGRQWTYQTCTEFGFFQTSSYTPQVFGRDFPVDFFIQQCVDIFGPKYNASFVYNSADRTNIVYGQLDIAVTNVVFVHGSIDPWHALGITQTRDQGAPAIYINGTAHCANMYTPSVNDLPQLKAARVQIAELIDSWIRL